MEQVYTSVTLLKTLNGKQQIDKKKLNRRLKVLLNLLKDSAAGENSIQDVLIKAKLLVMPLLEGKGVSYSVLSNTLCPHLHSPKKSVLVQDLTAG